MKNWLKSMQNIAVVVPNWNGKESLKACLDSLMRQTIKNSVVLVDNASVDNSAEYVQKNYPDVRIVNNLKNLGFSGGVNAGIKEAVELGADFVALFNNDAVAEASWLENLLNVLESQAELGIVTCKLLSADKSRLDSTGEEYTTWALSFPRGRDETDLNKYDGQKQIFAASGGASLYRVKMLEEIGLFDEKFFAYYEDVDLSFRAQLAGWKVAYVPEAVAYHQRGATSSRLRGFTTYHTLKNLPLLLNKNMPRRYLCRMGLRLDMIMALFFVRAITRGHGWSALKGVFMAVWLFPYSLRERRRIQHSRKVSDEHIWNMLVHDLPPNAAALRKLRAAWWRLRGKR